MCNTNSPKQLLYYALVVPRPNKGQAPFAVAEFISPSHSIWTISHILNTFHYGEAKLFGGTTCQPKYVIMDRNSAIFGSILSSFNNESTIDFYKRMYHLVTTSLKNLDEYFTTVIPHACLSHIIKDAKTEIKRRYVKLHVSCFNDIGIQFIMQFQLN